MKRFLMLLAGLVLAASQATAGSFVEGFVTGSTDGNQEVTDSYGYALGAGYWFTESQAVEARLTISDVETTGAVTTGKGKKAKTVDVTSETDSIGVDLNLIQKWARGSFAPFLTGGVGYVQIDQEDDYYSANAGGGIQIGLGHHLNLVGDARWVYPLTGERDGYLAAAAGVRLNLQ